MGVGGDGEVTPDPCGLGARGAWAWGQIWAMRAHCVSERKTFSRRLPRHPEKQATGEYRDVFMGVK